MANTPYLPTNREEFKTYILRRLGAPVIQINVDDQQVEDRIDDALQMFRDYHYDGTTKEFLAHQILDEDKTNRGFSLDDDIVGVVRLFPLSSAFGSQQLFSLTYQFAQSDFLSSALTGSIVPYWMAMMHIDQIEKVLVGLQPIRFNKVTNMIYVDMDWDRVNTGDWVVAEVYKDVDPDMYPDVWKDRWLLRYATALVKRQWGEQIKKFGQLPMAGGIVFNGQQIYDEAVREIDELELSVISDYSEPIRIFYN